LSEVSDCCSAADEPEPVVSELRSAAKAGLEGCIASDDHVSVNGMVGGTKTHSEVRVEVDLLSAGSTTGPGRK
jgi:hypothetical protein